MLKLFDLYKECCGCTACSSICPRNAIRMEPDSLGFFYPVIDTVKCIDCGLCSKMCSFTRELLSNNILASYVSRNIDMTEVETSRSGAVFMALAAKILENSGVIYGAAFSTDFTVIHGRASNYSQTCEFKGSKYAQSDMRGVLAQISEDLKQNRLVCFSGTPCQVAAVKSFIPVSVQDRLYLVDIVCHGVASPAIWKEHLFFIAQKYKARVQSANFRDKKKFGWADHRESFVVNDKSIYRRDSYYNQVHFRPSCSNCKYASLSRVSDITLADCWGIQEKDSRFNDNKGCNLVLLNTTKGIQWYQDVSSHLDSEPVNIDEFLQFNLQSPTPQHKDYDRFKYDYELKGFDYVMKKYCGWGFMNRLVRAIKRRIKI